MVWVRSLAFYALVLTYSALFSVAALAARPFLPLARRQTVFRAWCRVNRTVLAAVCGLRCRYIGLDLLPPPPFVIISNHQSTWETITLAAVLPPSVFVLKRSLLDMPLFGWAMRTVKPIAIDRGRKAAALRQLLTEGRAALAEGTSVIVFPEGTRFRPGALGPFSSGGSAMALAAGVPIVPIAHNAGRSWGAYSFPIHAGTVQVRAGSAIAAVGDGPADLRRLTAQVRAAIAAMAGEMEQPMPPATPAADGSRHRKAT